MGKILKREQVGRKTGAGIITLLLGLMSIIGLHVGLYFDMAYMIYGLVFFVGAIAYFIAFSLRGGDCDLISYRTKGIRIMDDTIFGSVTGLDIPVDEMKRVFVIEVANRFLPSPRNKTPFRTGRDQFSEVVFWGKPSARYAEILDQPDFINNVILVEKTNGDKYAMLSNDPYSVIESIKSHYPIQTDIA